MKKPERKTLLCAIYTRKSTDHNLDLEFNSLDAQREACEAYIKSQAHEGWRLIPARYDDGAFSGASLDRPALQQLLADVRAGKVNTVVVYKVDRLTRSLADFAKLVELFDEYGVSFVSITQSFNTTSSMGRLTLNVLLSFAQFEREVIGERVRDKIAASKRKGIWVGGPIPLGYQCVDKKLVIVPDEAETVRLIFRRYLELGSLSALIEELDRLGVRTKTNRLAAGGTRGGIRFGVGSLAHLLKNRFYVGEVVYQGENHRGEHEPIVDRDVFEAVQSKRAGTMVARRNRLKSSPAILAGRIFDDHGNRMSPTHCNKLGVRYRYYVSHALIQKRKAEAGSVARVPAPDIEALVLEAVRKHIKSGANAASPSDGELIKRNVDRVIVTPKALELYLIAATEASDPAQGADTGDAETSAAIQLSLHWEAPSFAAVKGIVHAPAAAAPMTAGTRDALLAAIAKARGWIEAMRSGEIGSFPEVAEREGQAERHIRLLAPLAFVSPRIIAAIVSSTAPADLTVTGLAKSLPYSWSQQERRIELFGPESAGS
jgi:DNA invertase Pin-like site-specific DNA recombinase